MHLLSESLTELFYMAQNIKCTLNGNSNSLNIKSVVWLQFYLYTVTYFLLFIVTDIFVMFYCFSHEMHYTNLIFSNLRQ